MKPLRLASSAAAVIRREVARAGGREVCFLCEVSSDREVVNPRAVARGNHQAVLAVAHDAPQGGLLVHNHPSGVLEPSRADLSVAARVWEEGLGTAITDNGAEGLYVVVEPPEPKVIHPLDGAALEATVSIGGVLSAIHPRFEEREGQKQMLKLVAECYNDDGVLVVEAGTGTGKSLSYLLPAAMWAAMNGERTVVSTNTINLQSQLDEKDLPLVARLLDEEGITVPARDRSAHPSEGDTSSGIDSPDDLSAGPEEGEKGGRGLRWAVMKGRANYISIRRAHLARQGAPTLFEEDRSGELDALLGWVDATEDGSLQDLSFVPSDDLWEEVQSDPDACLRGKCPHFQQCFYQQSRRTAASADIVVVNHHLLFTDLAVRRATENWASSAVLPPYKRLVLDEAHNLEDAATSHLGVQVTRRAMMRLFSRLDRKGKGLLASVQESLRGGGDRAVVVRTRIEERVRPALVEARSVALGFIEAVERVVPLEQRDGVRIGSGEGTIGEPAADREIEVRLQRLLDVMATLEDEIGRLRRMIDAEEELHQRLEGRLLDLGGVERRLSAHQSALRVVFAPSDQERSRFVRWLELRGRARRENLTAAAAPIELGPLLRETLYQVADTAVLSSATLTTRGKFDFVRSRVGLDTKGLLEMEKPPEVREAILPSPFDFSYQTVLAVPSDLPDRATQDREFQEETASVVRSLADVSGGGIFVLFTSHRAVHAVARALRDSGAAGEWPVFVHGEADRTRLLDDFVRSGRGILLGTSSFWEGVDVPGDPLRGLVIQKLPFRVPTEPITAARVEAIEKSGKDAFQGYMLPLAALRLKQGFGRLVRSTSDRGAVVILDDRIIRRRYGRVLIDSLPPAPLIRGPWHRIRGKLEEFYAEAVPQVGASDSGSHRLVSDVQ